MIITTEPCYNTACLKPSYCEAVMMMLKLDIMHGLTQTMDTEMLKSFYVGIDDLEKPFR